LLGDAVPQKHHSIAIPNLELSGKNPDCNSQEDKNGNWKSDHVRRLTALLKKAQASVKGNDEGRMTNDERIPNDQAKKEAKA
jgi:hypothetical protein